MSGFDRSLREPVIYPACINDGWPLRTGYRWFDVKKQDAEVVFFSPPRLVLSSLGIEPRSFSLIVEVGGFGFAVNILASIMARGANMQHWVQSCNNCGCTRRMSHVVSHKLHIGPLLLRQ